MPPAAVTGKERFQVTARGARPDKLALECGNDGMFLVHYYDTSIKDYIEDVEHQAELRVRMATDFPFDLYQSNTGYIFFGCGPETGVKWQWFDSNLPDACDWPIQTRQDLAEKFRIPEEPEGYYRKALEVMAEVNRRIGEKVFLTGRFLGPMSVAIYMRGLDNFLLDTATDLGFFHEYMPRFTQFSKFLGEHLVPIGLARVYANSIFATPELISPALYHREIAPYENQVIQHFAVTGRKVWGAGFISQVRPDDPEGRKEWRILYENHYNKQASIDIVRKALSCRLAPRPFTISVGGLALATWPPSEVLAYLKEACDLVVKGHRLYPVLSLPSIQPIAREDAAAIADKLRAIFEFRDGYKI